MDAEEYLLQIQDLTVRISQRNDQLLELRSTMRAISGVRYDSIRVTSSASSDAMTNKMIRLESLENSIAEDRLRLEEKKNEALNLIDRLSNTVYKKILYLRYVKVPRDGRMRSFAEISQSICYSVVHTKRMHAAALSELEKLIPNDTE